MYSMSDTRTFAPFVLIDDDIRMLVLSNESMLLKQPIFEERLVDGWLGNGLDWTSVASFIIDERLVHLKGLIHFDSEDKLFSAYGPIDELKELGLEMRFVYFNNDRLRDLLSRAPLH